QCGTVGDAVEPIADQVALAEARGLAGQHQERRLERVFGVVVVAKDAAAHSQNHRPVPPHDCRKRLFIPRPGEKLDELRVRNLGAGLRTGQPPQVTKHVRLSRGRHAVSLNQSALYLIPRELEKLRESLFEDSSRPRWMKRPQQSSSNIRLPAFATAM